MPIPEEKLRWWGWGSSDVAPPDVKGLLTFLEQKIRPWPDWTLPVPSLEDIPLRPFLVPTALSEELTGLVGADGWRSDHLARIRHAVGRGYRDLIRLRLKRVVSPPDVVVYPADHEQVSRLVDLAARYHAALVPFGGGSSVVGGLDLDEDIRPSICLDLTRMHGVKAIDRVSHTALVLAGTYGPDLEAILNQAGFTAGHFPQSFEFSTVGGWVATRGAGQKSNRYGKIENRVVSLKTVCPSGSIQTPRMPAHAAGSDLTAMLIGSEGGLGVITEVELRISPLPESQWFGAWLLPDFQTGLAAIRTMMVQGVAPATIRLSDPEETAALMAEAAARIRGPVQNFIMNRLAPWYLARRGLHLPGACLLLIIGEGHSQEVSLEKHLVKGFCRVQGGVAAGSTAARTWQETRYTAPYLRDELLTRGLLVETLETAAPWDRVPVVYDEVRRALRNSLDRSGTQSLVMTHVSHTYVDGANLYFTFIAAQERNHEEEQWVRVKDAATRAMVEAGGTVSHHHGVGRDHKPYLLRFWGRELTEVWQAAKSKLDPMAVMNPGVIFEPNLSFSPPEIYQPFSPALRSAFIENLTGETLDVLIIGGGIVGAGVAWDASLRGLTVGLVEKGDFASGTSGKSSRMIHGGLRYLKMLDLKLVRESLSERHHILHMAPHLVRPLKHVVPIYKGEGDSRMIMHLGLWGYDALAGSKGLPHHQTLSAEEILALEPHLMPNGLQGGLVYYDALTDDARLTLTILKAAARAGAATVNHAEVTLLSVADQGVTATIVDKLSGRQYLVRARVLVNATGAWSDRTRAVARLDTSQQLRPAKGVHIVYPLALKPISHVVVFKGADGRPLFAVPSGSMVYVGTTDTEYGGDLDVIRTEADEVDYLLTALNNVLTGPALTRDQVTASWAGIRPLVGAEGGEETKDISREHQILVENGRMITVCGGKLTTFRVMAAQTVDQVLTVLTGRVHTPCSTAELALSPPHRVSPMSPSGLPDKVLSRIQQKYGPEAPTILALMSSPMLAAVLEPDLGLTAAEVYWAVFGEMAMTLADAMTRRLGLLYMTTDNGMAVAGKVSKIMAGLLSWSETELENQLADYKYLVAKELSFRGST